MPASLMVVLLAGKVDAVSAVEETRCIYTIDISPSIFVNLRLSLGLVYHL
jgi:hypothetical protein